MGKSDRDSFNLQLLQKGNVNALQKIFNEYYNELLSFSNSITGSLQDSEEIILDVMNELWQRREELSIKYTLKNYLYSSIKNRSINYIKSKYARIEFTDLKDDFVNYNEPMISQSVDDLDTIIQSAIDRLPVQCRIIFRLSRDTGLTYKEIAAELEISPKTVHSQMNIALKRLREVIANEWDTD